MFSTLFLRIDRSRYEFADALANFDPVNDWLLSEKSYLTWREWGQQLPGDSEPIALMSNPSNFIMKSKDLVDKDLTWISNVMNKRFANLTTATWKASNYRGMLSLPKNMPGVESRLLTFNAFVAPNPGAIHAVDFPEWRFGNQDGPKLAFCDDLQIRSLYLRHPHQDVGTIWRRLLPAIVMNLRAYQRAHLKLAA